VTDVTVVGGGIIGLACAWRTAQRGASVVVRDPRPATGASHAAAGMLCPVTEVHYGEQPLLALNLESARRWSSFAAELGEASGIDVGYRAEGTVAVAFDDDDLRALDELLRFQQALGLDVERLRARECRSLEPQLSPRVRGGVLVAGDHQVDNRRVLAALLVACERAGVRVEHRAVGDIEQLASPSVYGPPPISCPASASWRSWSATSSRGGQRRARIPPWTSWTGSSATLPTGGSSSSAGHPPLRRSRWLSVRIRMKSPRDGIAFTTPTPSFSTTVATSSA
jgi:hypothetical protein